jgi:hypothetical protein
LRLPQPFPANLLTSFRSRIVEGASPMKEIVTGDA